MCNGSVFFFFSSRRRHTRFDCDWSSDVCSSDLEEAEQWTDQELRDRVPGRDLGARPPEFPRSEEHTSELQSQSNLVCRLLLEKKKNTIPPGHTLRPFRLKVGPQFRPPYQRDIVP